MKPEIHSLEELRAHMRRAYERAQAHTDAVALISERERVEAAGFQRGLSAALTLVEITIGTIEDDRRGAAITPPQRKQMEPGLLAIRKVAADCALEAHDRFCDYEEVVSTTDRLSFLLSNLMLWADQEGLDRTAILIDAARYYNEHYAPD